MKIILPIEDNTDIGENTCELHELEGYEVKFTANVVAPIAIYLPLNPPI